jgi:23S rRNA pseudouridine2604 synthase
MRLNKYLSGTGLCSRREADALIEAGRVRVNGELAALGTPVTEGDAVTLDGRPVGAQRPPLYIALNKPVGITCTSEAHVRDNVVDFVGHPERIFPIGRLDKESEGLILLTNDGDAVNPILRAESGLEKEYYVAVDRPVTERVLSLMARGVRLRDVPQQGRGVLQEVTTRPCEIEQIDDQAFRIVLTQGLNRQIRRMCDAFHWQVTRLQRVRIGALALGALDYGHWRYLEPDEVRELGVGRDGFVR